MTNPDTAPPTLTALSFPTSIDLTHGSVPVTFSATASDGTGSGVYSIDIQLNRPFSRTTPERAALPIFN